MTKASDNAFPSILLTEGTEPAAPAAGKQRIYIDSTTHLLKATNSSGTDRTIEGIAAGAITSSGLTMATARLLGRTSASSGAVEEITVGSGLSLAAGALTASGGIGTDYASASTNTATVFTSGAALAIVDFEDVTFDPGSDITTGASWHYTIPTTGIYRVDALITFAGSTGWAVAERGFMQLFKNGAAYRTLDRKDGLVSSGSTLTMLLNGTTLVSCTAADTIDIRLTQNIGGNLALDGVAENNYVDIHRIA